MRTDFSFTNCAFLISVSLVFCTSCSSNSDDKPLVVTPASISMHYEDTQQLSAEGATSWLSNDEFVAKVNSSGLVTGNHVGNTEIVVSDGKSTANCNITITPEYYLYDDPILQWGASMSSIESAEKHKKESSTSNIITYNYAFDSNACAVGYSFENGKLKSVMALFSYSLYVKAALYLIERFQPIAAGNDYDYVLVDALKEDRCKTVVYYTSYKSGKNTYTSIMYMDYSALNKAKSRSAAEYNPNNDEMTKELVKMIEN